ncbi:E3 SUMO-protein ligase SIZ1, partial [Ananas comosus]
GSGVISGEITGVKASEELDEVSDLNGCSRKDFIGKEEVAKIIDDTYRQMQVPKATDSASKSHSCLANNVKSKKEIADFAQIDIKVRCPCGSSSTTENMIKCEDPRCNVWQHIDCVIVPEKPIEGVPPEVPSCFYCELCRINRADPFWLTICHPLLPVKLDSSSIDADRETILQSVEKNFPLSRSNREMLQRSEFDLQVWCILLNDKVPFRMHWPLNAALDVNGVSILIFDRPRAKELGINGRDDGAVITVCSREGSNKICLSRSNGGVFCFGVRIAKRLTVDQVLSLVPKEADGENFNDALVRVCRCINGGTATENADSDSDIEVVSNSMSGSRIKVAARFKQCDHMGCFNLETFVELNQRSRKWQCPICMKNYSLESIVIDPYFNRITSLMQNCGEDVTEIEARLDGSWRVKNGSTYRELSQWHSPDGTLCMAKDEEPRPKSDITQQIRQEGSRIKNNYNELWEDVKPEEFKPLAFEIQVLENFENKNTSSMNCSATDNFRDVENPCVSQEFKLDSLSLNFERDPAATSPKDADVIILSDSDEENIAVVSAIAGTTLHTGNSYSGNLPEASRTYVEGPGLVTSRTSSVDLLDSDTDEFGVPFWDYQTSPQTDRSSQVLNSSIDGYGPISGGNIGQTTQNPLVADLAGSLIDNPSKFVQGDHSLVGLLSKELDNGKMKATYNDCSTTSTTTTNCGNSDNWISPGVGGDSGFTKGLDLGGQFDDLEMERLVNADGASILGSMKYDRVDKTNPKSQPSFGPFSPPRQPRSVRQRLVLSIDTDSD